MEYTKTEITEGVNLHLINTSKFKTNLLAFFMTLPLSRETITLNALIPAILRRGTKNYKTMEELSIKLEEMYGASFDCGIEKRGDNAVIKFYLESVNEKFLNTDESILKESIKTLLEIVLNPYLENGTFKKEYVDGEKEVIRQLINSKIDNKDAYAIQKATEVMFEGEPFEIYKYGYIEDLEKITPSIAYNHYKNMIENARIDMFVSGSFDEKEIADYASNLIKLTPRKNSIVKNENRLKQDVKEVKENMDITQGKLVMGLKVDYSKDNAKAVGSIYNTILGGSSNSKMFQNVREKASLAYTAGSNYLLQKASILIRCGIEIKNFQKAVDLIKVQIEDMRQGNFSDNDIKNAKKYVESSMTSIKDDQSGLIDYYLSQYLFEDKVKTIDDYINERNNVTKEDIMEFASCVNLDTVYFLTNDNLGKGDDTNGNN